MFMSQTFYPGCASREDELRLLQRLSEENRTLQTESQQYGSQLESAQSALDAALGRAQGHGTQGSAEPEFSPNAPDPIADPEGFQRWTNGLVSSTDRRITQLQEEQREAEAGRALWQQFQMEHPSLSEHPELVQAAFLAERPDGSMPGSLEEAERLRQSVADRIRSYGVQEEEAEEAANSHASSSPFDDLGIPQTLGDDEDEDRTAGIPGGSHGSPSAGAPATQESNPRDLVETLKSVRSSPEMAGYF